MDVHADAREGSWATPHEGTLTLGAGRLPLRPSRMLTGQARQGWGKAGQLKPLPLTLPTSPQVRNEKCQGVY